MKTSSAMTRDIVVVPPSARLSEARRVMDRMHIRHLPVVAGGALVGILSDRDLLRQQGDDRARLCGDVMTPSPLICSPDTSVSQVAALMIDHKVDCVPVVSGGTLVGLVTSTDLLELLIQREEAQALPFDFRLHVSPSDEDLETFAASQRARARLVA
jgi:acetoin utilization protein AcuB